ncbi:MAG: hypothetical protein ABL867_08095, partial [Rickettsiales bacterium]
TMPDPIKKTYVEFIHPGDFFSKSSIKEIPSRDAKIELPESAYAYRMFDHETVVIGEKKFSTERYNVSGLNYVDGDVLSVDDVKKTVPNNRAIVSNMQINKWDYVVCDRSGNFHSLNKGDSVTKGGKTIYPDEKTFPPVQKQR